MRFHHYIWDFDGTLFNTYPAMVCAFQKTLEQFGIAEPYETIYRLMKQTLAHAVDYYTCRYALPDTFFHSFQVNRAVQEETTAKPFPFAKELCSLIVKNNGANYLCTHRGYSAVEALERYGMRNHFCDFTLKENGFARKPSPDAVRYLMERHSITGTDAVMIGDRELDLLAGKNAGTASCYFDAEKTGPIPHADFHIQSLRDMLPLFGIQTDFHTESGPVTINS